MFISNAFNEFLLGLRTLGDREASAKLDNFYSKSAEFEALLTGLTQTSHLDSASLSHVLDGAAYAHPNDPLSFLKAITKIDLETLKLNAEKSDTNTPCARDLIERANALVESYESFPADMRSRAFLMLPAPEDVVFYFERPTNYRLASQAMICWPD